MPIYKRVNGAWVATAPKKRVGGSTVNATSLLVRVAGVWVEKLGFTVSVGNVNLGDVPNGTRSGSSTATVTGGSGSFTYAWSWQSGGTNVTITNPAAATTGFNTSGTNVLRQGVFKCVVTDTVTGQTVTATKTFRCQFGTPM